MKIFHISLALFFLAVFSVTAESYPPEGWTSNLLEALAESERTGKDVLLDFTGSDWCGWCHKLTDEVFSQQEFKEYARENLVLVHLDFPQDIELPDETVFQNELMAQLFGVRGFPTIWLMDSEQVPVLQTGYQEGGPSVFIDALENNRIQLDEETRLKNQQIIRDTIRDYLGEW